MRPSTHSTDPSILKDAIVEIVTREVEATGKSPSYEKIAKQLESKHKEEFSSGFVQHAIFSLIREGRLFRSKERTWHNLRPTKGTGSGRVSA